MVPIPADSMEGASWHKNIKAALVCWIALVLAGLMVGTAGYLLTEETILNIGVGLLCAAGIMVVILIFWGLALICARIIKAMLRFCALACGAIWGATVAFITQSSSSYYLYFCVFILNAAWFGIFLFNGWLAGATVIITSIMMSQYAFRRKIPKRWIWPFALILAWWISAPLFLYAIRRLKTRGQEKCPHCGSDLLGTNAECQMCGMSRLEMLSAGGNWRPGRLFRPSEAFFACMMAFGLFALSIWSAPALMPEYRKMEIKRRSLLLAIRIGGLPADLKTLGPYAIIENKGHEDWYNVRAEINGQYFAKIRGIRGNKRYVIIMSDFASEDGKRFDPIEQSAIKMRVSADTMFGRLECSGEMEIVNLQEADESMFSNEGVMPIPVGGALNW